MNARNAVLVVAVTTIAVAQAAAEEVDLAVVHRIKADAFANGRVMDHMFFLTEAGFWRAGSAVPPPVVVIKPESHGRLTRLVERGHAVRVELEVDVELGDSDRDAANVIAELPGGRKADEVVMIGAHLDSWHGGTGATDNAAGCAVMLEAMRILKALDLKLDRTVRLALWTGEEQGIFGSRAYVREHFADPITMARKPEHARLAAYFNVDNGTGKIRGVYLQGNDMVRPIFDAWLAPFADMGARTLTIRDTHGTDHLRSTPWACRASSSSRTRSTTRRARTTPTSTSTTTRSART
jgi:hypothetical protein